MENSDEHQGNDPGGVRWASLLAGCVCRRDQDTGAAAMRTDAQIDRLLGGADQAANESRHRVWRALRTPIGHRREVAGAGLILMRTAWATPRWRQNP